LYGKARRESLQLLACKYLHEIPLRALSCEEFGVMSNTVRCPNLGRMENPYNFHGRILKFSSACIFI
jgi:hypothetical protein